jgi:subfamily B ATP-binding cassette protein MsbA
MYKRVLTYLRPYRGEFVLGMCCMVLFGATDGVVPFLVQRILDGVFTNHDRSMLTILPLILMGFALIRALVDFGQEFIMSRLGHRVVRDLRRDVHAHTLRLAPEFFVKHSAGEMISRVTSDVMLIRTLLTDSAAAVIRDSVRIVALIASAIYLDPILALIAVVVFPLAALPIARIGKKIRRLSRSGAESVGAISTIVQESMLGNRVIKIFCREDFELRRFTAENEKLTHTQIRSERARALAGPINEVLASLAISGVLLYGGYSVLNGQRTQGEFLAFLLAIFLTYEPFKKLSRVNAVVQQGLAGASRLFEVLDTVPTIADPIEPKPLGRQNSIELRGVTFQYPTASGEPALSGVELSIREGEKVALVGLSGSGKSTLTDLIPRFIDPTEGAVLLGGVDIRTVSLSELRSRIALVNQHTFLFNDSIYNNILYGRLDASREEVIEAARAAYALAFIEALPDGLNTTIGEAGMRLSGGERQRIAIARAILKNAPILILDEATASLDNRSEREVQDALARLEEGRTSLIVAHRLSTIRSADRIVVMSHGRVVEVGNHDALLQKGGEYKKLHDLQFSESQEHAG